MKSKFIKIFRFFNSFFCKHDCILVKCESGRYIAYYEHRTDIIANGENERDAKKNLKKMYIEIIQMEEAEAESEPPLKLPPYTETKKV